MPSLTSAPTKTPLYLTLCRRRPGREEGVLQRVGWLDPLLRVQRKAVLEQVDEVVQVPGLGVVHAR